MSKNQMEWIDSIREVSLLPESPLQHKNGRWEFTDRLKSWQALAPRIFDDYLDRFQKVAVDVLGERDPQFELEPDQRYAASIHGKNLKHSHEFRRGLAETLALLGSFPELLTSCSDGKAENTAIFAIRQILEQADWVLWASVNDLLPLFAEAAPKEFLDAVENSLQQSPCPFKDIYAQERSGIMGRNYMTGLLWALETLAWHSDYLMRVVLLLGELAAIDPGGNWCNRPINSLMDILLPWHPQTCADIPKRKMSIITLLRAEPKVGWKLLVHLLPDTHSSTSGTHKPTFRKLISPDWSEKVTNEEYWQQVIGYAELAVDAAIKEPFRLAELVGHLSHLPNPANSRFIQHLSSNAVVDLPEADRYPIWQALITLISKHRKFSDAQWAMPNERLTELEAISTKLAPKSLELIYRRLFTDHDIDLYEGRGDYQEQHQNVNRRRQTAVQEILKSKQLSGVLDFSKIVAAPQKVGYALGSIGEDSIDQALLPGYLSEDKKDFSAFIRGYLWGRFSTKSWQWVDSVVTESWTTEQKVSLLGILPFTKETWQRADRFLADQIGEYWKNSHANQWEAKEHLLEAVHKLLQYNRPQAAVRCLGELVHQQVNFPPELAICALMESLKGEESTHALDRHDILELIKWLQDNPAADTDHLFKIELAYLQLLDNQFGGAPKTLERRLASDASFFCDLIKIAFRSDKDEDKKREPTEEERNAAQNGYRLLSAWKTVPGSSPNSPFDGAAFSKWLASVKEKSAESGHFRIAMSQIGQVLPYAPPDPNGLWIHQSVAQALDAKDATEMRSGFTCERFNMRGVHTHTAGREEREIAASFRKEADDLEQYGYARFATAMRELAKAYERDAEREAKRDPFED